MMPAESSSARSGPLGLQSMKIQVSSQSWRRTSLRSRWTSESMSLLR